MRPYNEWPNPGDGELQKCGPTMSVTFQNTQGNRLKSQRNSEYCYCVPAATVLMRLIRRWQSLWYCEQQRVRAAVVVPNLPFVIATVATCFSRRFLVSMQ